MDEKAPLRLLINGREITIPAPVSARRPNSARSAVGEKKDYCRENVQRMRHAQKKSKLLEEERKKPVKPLWKSKRYENVESRICHMEDDAKESERSESNRPHSAFLRAHSKSGPSVQDSYRPFTPKHTEKRTSVPPASIASVFKPIRNDCDFVHTNGKSAKTATQIKNPELAALDNLHQKREEEFKHYRKGEVPKYLKNRKELWKKEEEDRIANTPDPAMPPDHKMMPEAERLQTLEILKNNEKELTKKLCALPLRNDTLWVRSQKIDLEKQLRETEEALKIFSKSKVFVKCEK